MSAPADRVWAALREAGLVQGAAPETDRVESPWFVKVLLGFSGWLAAVFLLGFVAIGLEFIVKSTVASFITGGLMIGGAFAILRMPKNEFFEHLGLALSLAGQALVVYAIFEVARGNDSAAWMLIALFQAPLALIMPSFVHRVFSSFVSAFSLAVALMLLQAPHILAGVVTFIAAWLWLNEYSYPKYLKVVQANGYGLVLALIPMTAMTSLGLGAAIWQPTRTGAETWIQPWMGEVLAAAVALYVVWQLLRRHGQTLSGRYALGALLGTLAIAAVSLEAKGITIGMVVMLLGFAGGNRVLLGLGVVSLLFYISSYYYTLEATLLAKSQTLLIVGLVLLVARFLMVRFMTGGGEVKHA